MKRKQLAIMLSKYYLDFQNPVLELEQYGTTVDTATHLVFRAWNNGDIEGKDIVDLCAGPGILGISALLLGARSCTFVEIDPKTVEILERNLFQFDPNGIWEVKNLNALEVKGHFDTCVMNPPFGIQQGIGDKEFLRKAIEISDTVYSIHDGSEANQSFLPRFVRKMGAIPVDYYTTELSLRRSFSFHKKRVLAHNIMVLRSIKEYRDEDKEKV